MDSATKVANVLAGQASYDTLTEGEQAVVRATWEERDNAALSALNFAAEFKAAGESYSEADEHGNLTY